ncbi:MAG: TonB-dependent receptor [Rhodospirillales bacterium]|nr:TonB-dependent receptor [Rhodospirillales bacterium]
MRKGYLGASALAIIILPTTFWAHQSAAQKDQPTASAGALEEVVVTARRRTENLQSVPISATAVIGAALDRRGVIDAQDLQSLVPSLTVSSPSAREMSSFTLRGQGQTLGAGPGVVTYFAEAPVPSGVVGGPGLYYDVANIQVLNGPQGTLFGRNTTGGAVLIQPQRPTDHFGGFGELGYGNYDNREGTGMINIPIVEDKLNVRAAGTFRYRDGFTKDVTNGKTYDDTRYWSSRLSIQFKPTDQLRNEFVFQNLYSHPNGTGYEISAVNPNFQFWTFFPGLLATAQSSLAKQKALGPRYTTSDSGTRFKADTWAIVNTTTYDFSDDLHLKNIFSYTNTRVDNRIDVDGSAAPIFQSVDTPYPANLAEQQLSFEEYFTDELQFSGKALSDALTWVAGMYYEYYTPAGYQQSDVLQFGSVIESEQGISSLSRALYAQGTYDLGTFSPALEGLKFTGGYRFTRDHKSSFTNSYTLAPEHCSYLASAGRNCLVNFDKNFSASTRTLSLEYQIDPKTFVYVTNRTGYKAGGFNTIGDPSNPFAAFGPERVEDEEIGIKADFPIAGIPVRADLALFNTEYSDIQRSVLNTVNRVVSSYTVNAASASIQGLEFQGTIRPTAGLELTGSYAFLYAVYGKFLGGPNPGDPNYSGQLLPNAPRHSISLSATYYLPVDESLGDISVTGNLFYESRFRAQDTQGDPTVADYGNYALTNLSVKWASMFGSQLDLSVYVNNLLDRTYRINGFPYYNLLGLDTYTYGEPRTFGARARYNF